MWRGFTCVNNINKDSKYDTSGGDPQLSYKRRDIMKWENAGKADGICPITSHVLLVNWQCITSLH